MFIFIDLKIYTSSAAVSPNPEQHLRGEQLHHHLPGPHRHAGRIHVAQPTAAPAPIQPRLAHRAKVSTASKGVNETS